MSVSIESGETTIEFYESWKSYYRDHFGLYQNLETVIEHAIEKNIKHHGIKIDQIEKRVKNEESFILKLKKKNLGEKIDQTSITDTVGIRVICLFRSDIDRISKIIEQTFSVISKDDKVVSSITEFGYMSVHQICKIPEWWKGPYYDDVKHLLFEIQVRTIAMHAWAAISHHIEYKRDADVPASLKKSLNALSGLFYVADDQFESFIKLAQENRADAEKSLVCENNQVRTKLNLDTLAALARKEFPDRSDIGANFSDLLSQLLQFGLTTVEDLLALIEGSREEFERYEKIVKEAQGSTFCYLATGAVRVSLRLRSDRWLKYSIKNEKDILREIDRRAICESIPRD